MCVAACMRACVHGCMHVGMRLCMNPRTPFAMPVLRTSRSPASSLSSTRWLTSGLCGWLGHGPPAPLWMRLRVLPGWLSAAEAPARGVCARGEGQGGVADAVAGGEESSTASGAWGRAVRVGAPQRGQRRRPGPGLCRDGPGPASASGARLVLLLRRLLR
jgi:hypothetical protein